MAELNNMHLMKLEIIKELKIGVVVIFGHVALFYIFYYLENFLGNVAILTI